MVPDVILINRDAWRRLTPHHQALLQQAADDSARFQRQLWAKKTAEALEEVAAAGVEVSRPEKGPFQEAVRSLHEAYAGTEIGALITEIAAVPGGENSKKLKDALTRVLEGVVVVLMGALVIDVLWQVASRHVVRNPSGWTDELATLLMIWLALMGASAAFGRQAHLGVDFLTQKLTPPHRRVAEVIVYCVVAFFAVAVLIVGGLHLVTLTLLTNQVSPALGVKMGHVYLSLPISGGFILLFSVEAVAQRFARQGDAGEEGAT
jgi:TRAP-type C4-dicarboxylate transport system permease small subunit